MRGLTVCVRMHMVVCGEQGEQCTHADERSTSYVYVYVCARVCESVKDRYCGVKTDIVEK